MYNKIKKQKGERFAKTLRDYHNGILEIPHLDVLLRYAGQEAEPLIPYLLSLAIANDDMPAATGHPFELLKQAGYDAFFADTREKQNSIRHYFAQGELLCTFSDASRYEDYYIVHAVKEGADKIRREDFKGKEKRQDTYGTSVISIQMRKNGGFISIKNRYNHTVDNCDNTFNSNPDNIVKGLSLALKTHFNVEFSVSNTPLPEGYAVFGNHIVKYHTEAENIYYGDALWVENGEIKRVNKSVGEAMFDGFIFDHKTKRLEKIDRNNLDSFPDDFNRCYGGNKGLYIKNGNLMLGNDVLIGAEKSRIKTIYLPDLRTASFNFLHEAPTLTEFNAPLLTETADSFLCQSYFLTSFQAPSLTTMGYGGLKEARRLKEFNAPLLRSMGQNCLCKAPALVVFNAPSLAKMGMYCLDIVHALAEFNVPSLTTMEGYCLHEAYSLTKFDAPSLITMEGHCLYEAKALETFNAPKMVRMGNNCLHEAPKLANFNAPAFKNTPDHILKRVSKNTARQQGSVRGALRSLELRW